MTDWKKISLRKFIDTYNSYPPNGWIRFAFKYFSKSTEVENMKPKTWISGILLGLFGIGMFGTILNWSKALIGIVTITYTALLGMLVMFLLSAVWMNNARIKKIAKQLDISIEEYNLLVNKYF